MVHHRLAGAAIHLRAEDELLRLVLGVVLAEDVFSCPRTSGVRSRIQACIVSTCVARASMSRSVVSSMRAACTRASRTRGSRRRLSFASRSWYCDHPFQEVLQRLALELAGGGQQPRRARWRSATGTRRALRSSLRKSSFLSSGDFVERRLGDVEVALGDELRHLAVKEGQQQGPDVAAVHVGVRHQDDAVVAHAGRVVVLAPDARPQRGDEGHDFPAGEHLLEARLLHVEDFAASGRIAWLRRSRPCLAEPPAESPSTM